MTTYLRFVSYDEEDLIAGGVSGWTPLGELTSASQKSILAQYLGTGSGEFNINWHATDQTYCRPGRYVLAYLEPARTGSLTTDPFFGFWVSESEDVVVSPDEQGGDVFHRSGEGSIAVLSDAIVWHEAVTTNDAAAPNEEDDFWHWTAAMGVHAGGIMVRMLEEAQERDCFPFVTYDFSRTLDSNGDAWTSATAIEDFQLPIGEDLLNVASLLQQVGLTFVMDPDFVLHAYETTSYGTDRTATVTFERAVNISSGAGRHVIAAPARSTTLVKGTRGDNGLTTYVPTDSAAGLLELKRRKEGFLDANTTTGFDTLTNLGLEAIYQKLRLKAGPSGFGVYDTGLDPFTDYFPGDTVTVDVPGVWEADERQITDIVITDTEAGDVDVVVGFDAGPAYQSKATTNPAPAIRGDMGCCPAEGPFVPEYEAGAALHAIMWGPKNWGGGGIMPDVLWQSDGDAPDGGHSADPKVGAVDYFVDTIGGHTEDAGFEFTADAVVDVNANLDYTAGVTGTVINRTSILLDGVEVAFNNDVTSGGLRLIADDAFVSVTGLAVASGQILTVKMDSSWGDAMTVPVGSGDPTHQFEVTGTSASSTPTNTPSEGQTVHEEILGDGSTTDFVTNFPYLPGSLTVHVNGVLAPVTEADPAAGEFSLPFVVPAGARIVVHYQATGGAYLGSGNGSPSTTAYVIPPILLGSGSDGSGDNVLHDDGTWSPVTGGGVGGLQWFDVTTYGALGDGSTDDRSAINDAIADLNAAGGGVLYFPAVAAGDYYYVSNALTTITVTCTIQGDGGGAAAPSPIATDHATANLFTLSAANIRVTGLKLINYGGTESAGAAIAVTTGYGSYNRYDHLWVEGFYDGMSLIYGAQWAMSECEITNPVRYGLRIANVDIPDGGDWSMSDVWFGTRSRNATTAIYQESAGGGKLVNVKINCNTAADQATYGGAKKYVTGHHVYINGATNSTSVMTMVGSSIENVSGDAVYIQTNGTGAFGLIAIAGLEVALYSNNSGRAVKVSAATNGTIGTNGSIAGVTIDGLVARTDGTARAAVELVNTDRVSLGSMALTQNFTSRYTSSGDTNTTDGGASFATPAIVLGTAAAAGAASTVIRSDSTIVAFDATVPTTQAFGDAAATGSAAVAARRDHKHAMPAAPSSTPSILLDSGHATPFTFGEILQESDGSDFLWASA